MGGMADQNGARGEPALFRLRCAHENECSCPIRDRGGIGGRHSATVAKCRAKGRYLVQFRLAGLLVNRNFNFAAPSLHGDGRDFGGEKPILDSILRTRQ